MLSFISSAFTASSSYVYARFVRISDYRLSRRMNKAYRRQPASSFLNKKSANLGKNILSEADLVVGRRSNPLLELITRLIKENKTSNEIQ